MWTYPEISAGFLVACLPVSPIFVKSLSEKWSSLRMGSSPKSLLPIHRSADSLVAGDVVPDWKLNYRKALPRHQKTGSNRPYQNDLDDPRVHQGSSIPSSSESSKDQVSAYENPRHDEMYTLYKMKPKDMF